MTDTKLADRIKSMCNDIRQDALPNHGEEKDQWLADLQEVESILRTLVIKSVLPPLGTGPTKGFHEL